MSRRTANSLSRNTSAETTRHYECRTAPFAPCVRQLKLSVHLWKSRRFHQGSGRAVQAVSAKGSAKGFFWTALLAGLWSWV